MNVFHMTCFAMLAKTSTFYEAAEKLYLSQSSFSYNIHTLERELGVSLITREARGFSLTEAGRTFMEYAERIVREYERMTEMLAEYKKSVENRVCVYAEAFSGYCYNDILIDFKQAEPNIQTEIAEVNADQVLSIVKSSHNAVGIIFTVDIKAIDGVKCQPMLRDRLVALVSKNHPLAHRGSISMRELENETLQCVGMRRSTFFINYMVQQCRKAGFEPEISPFSLWYSTITELLRNLELTAVISQKAAGIFCRPDLRIIEISDAEPFYVNAVISEGHTYEATQRFFNFAASYCSME